MFVLSYVYSDILLFTLTLLICIGLGQASGEFCYIDSRYKYCEYGCCSEKCCDMSTLAIVGVAIGAVLGVVAVVGCIVCLVCMCKQANANRNASMVHPIHNNTNSVYVSNVPNHPPPRAAPPNYNQYSSYPGSSDTSYGFNDPAYPPGYHPPPAYTYSNPKSGKS